MSDGYVQFMLKVFHMEPWQKIIIIVVLNMFLLSAGMFLSRTIARGFSYAHYCKAGILKRKMLTNKNIDNFPKGYFKTYSFKWYRNNIISILILFILFLVQTVFLNFKEAFKYGTYVYFILILSAVFVVPFLGRRGLGRMFMDEEGFRNEIKSIEEKKEKDANKS